MKLFNRLSLLLAASVAISFSSCVESDLIPFEEVEKVALDAGIKINKPELVANYQERGGYYVELLDEGVADSMAVRNAEGNPP